MSIELNEFLSLKGDQGMKNILFCSKKPKITKKGLEVSICTHTAQMKIWVAGSAAKMGEIWILVQAVEVCL